MRTYCEAKRGLRGAFVSLLLAVAVAVRSRSGDTASGTTRSIEQTIEFWRPKSPPLRLAGGVCHLAAAARGGDGERAVVPALAERTVINLYNANT